LQAISLRFGLHVSEHISFCPSAAVPALLERTFVHGFQLKFGRTGRIVIPYDGEELANLTLYSSEGANLGTAKTILHTKWDNQEIQHEPGMHEAIVGTGLTVTFQDVTSTVDERGMPTALCAYPGKYDPPAVNAADFEKFFAHAFPILKGPGWAPTESDERILQILGALVLRIDQGINLTDEYIAHNVELIAGGYIGDQARKKLQQEYVRRMTDPNDIYWPFRSRL
jgi:hypothetical protein